MPEFKIGDEVWWQNNAFVWAVTISGQFGNFFDVREGCENGKKGCAHRNDLHTTELAATEAALKSAKESVEYLTYKTKKLKAA